APCWNGAVSAAWSAAHLEVHGVHVQLVAVQLAQLGEGLLDVVQVLDGISEGGEHLLAVRLHPGVARDGSWAGEVPKMAEQPLGPGVDDQEAAGKKGERGQLLLQRAGDVRLVSAGPAPRGLTRPGSPLR
uniref:Uncharacterized protein n=1 Tax=Varanus komodoensis TaxID=61221 RepID=A0A8D2LCH9_VARKO